MIIWSFLVLIKCLTPEDPRWNGYKKFPFKSISCSSMFIVLPKKRSGVWIVDVQGISQMINQCFFVSLLKTKDVWPMETTVNVKPWWRRHRLAPLKFIMFYLLTVNISLKYKLALLIKRIGSPLTRTYISHKYKRY